MSKKIGLVLSGGGAKGAYQLGVWQALLDLGIATLISGVSGTSVGAINGILFAQGDIKVGYEIWEKAKVDAINVNDLNKRQRLLYKVFGEPNMTAVYNITRAEILKTENLKAGISQYLDSEKIKKFPGDCFVASHDIKNNVPNYFNLKNYNKTEQVKIVLSSASIPFIFSSVSIDGKKYNDGGLSDNTPVKPLYEAGYDTLIVVYLNQHGFYSPEAFPGCTLINLIPSVSLGDFRTGTLNFSAEKIDSLIKQGYDDTINTLDQMEKLRTLIAK